MATFTRLAMRPVKTLSGMAIPTQSFPEALSMTFKAGAPCFLSAGYLNECGTDPTLIMGLATRDGQNGSANGTYSQVVALAHPETLFLGTLENGGSQGTGTSAATDRGKMYGILKGSSGGKWIVDLADVTNKRVVIWDSWNQPIDGVTPAFGDVLLPVIFSFDPQYFQGNRTS